MIIALNNTKFKELIETFEKFKLNTGTSGKETIKIEPFSYKYILYLDEEKIEIESNSRDVDTFFNKIHTTSEIKNRKRVKAPSVCLKDVIEEELHVKLWRLEECQK